MVDESLEAIFKEGIDLTIKAKLKGKYKKSGIDSLTQKYHNKIETGVDVVDNVQMLLLFDMRWQKKGTGHTYDSQSGHAYFIGVGGGKVIRVNVYSKNVVFVTFPL